MYASRVGYRVFFYDPQLYNNTSHVLRWNIHALLESLQNQNVFKLGGSRGYDPMVVDVLAVNQMIIIIRSFMRDPFLIRDDTYQSFHPNGVHASRWALHPRSSTFRVVSGSQSKITSKLSPSCGLICSNPSLDP